MEQGKIHISAIPQGAVLVEVKTKDNMYPLSRSPFLTHYEYEGKLVFWNGERSGMPFKVKSQQ